jgi:septal ring factor EnvC (AmiA/AmiB activator)
MGLSRFVVAALALTLSADAMMLRNTAQVQANPIRKVVTLLQALQKKVTEEGEKEKELYEKFMCYCTSSGGALDGSIAAAENKNPQLTAEIEASEGKLKVTKEELKQAQVDRSSAKEAIATATAIREKEAAAFAAFKADADVNIAAIAKATSAVEKGMGGSFLQTEDAQTLRNIVKNSQDMISGDAEELTAFLSSTQGTNYAPQSGEISGILKQMGDTMAAALKDASDSESASIKSFEGLVAAKTKEITALTAAIEAKTKQIGELGVAIVAMKEDLDDTTKGLLADQKFKADLEKGCATKTGEWEERQKTRSEELVALADTVKVLNDDDALDLFKKTLPSAGSSSFVQVKVSAEALRSRALLQIRAALEKSDKGNKAGLELLVTALTSKKGLSKGGFDKVIKMIDDMVVLLKTEQMDDEHKKEYCAAQFDTADDKKKGLERGVADTENAIATASEAIATATEEIAALTKGIKDLDKSVAEATEQRKEENVEFKDLIASDTAAKELMKFAKNRLNKFYNPKLYVAPPKQELSREDRIAVNMGGEAPTTPAPGGIAGTGVTVFLQTSSVGAPPPPPETFGAYSKKSEESTGVIGMIDLLISDLDKEMTEATTEEKNAQADYEEMMGESASKRTTDSKALADKESAKADLEVDLESYKTTKTSTTKELMATLKYIESLHAECDWLLKYFDVRKEARAGEIDALTKAKAVLSGADYSFVQIVKAMF